MDQCLPCLSPGDKAHSTSPRRLSSRAEDWRRCWERRMVQELQMQIRHIRKMVLLYTGPLELRWRERYDMIYFYFFYFLFYVISVVDNVEHHSFLQHLFAGCYGVPLLLFQFQTGHWLRLWRETWVKQRLRLRCHGMSWMSGACGSSTSSEMLWRFGLQRPLNLGPVCINYPLVI